MDFDSRFQALRRPLYRRYWLASFASVGATQLQILGQGWLLYKITGSALMLGYLGAVAAIPAIVMTVFGGAFADQFDKRKLLMITSFLIGCLLLILSLLDMTNLVQGWQVILIAGLISFINGFDWPTRQAVFPLLIEREDMMSAVALNSIIWQTTRMVMPAVGGLVMAFGSTWMVFMIGAVGFFTMFAVISGLHLTIQGTRGPVGSTLEQVSEGIRYILHTRIFLVFIGLSFTSMFLANSYLQLMPAFSDLLQTDETGYGYLVSIGGVGSVMGTLLIGSFQKSDHLGRIILAAAFLNGTFVYLFAASVMFPENTNYVIALVAVFLIALFSSMYMIAAMTVLQLEVPDELRGRVMGLHGITYSLMPLGGLLAGFIASVSSAPLAISINTTIFLLLVIAVAATQGEARAVAGHH